MYPRASQVAQWIKNPPANLGDIKDSGLIPGLGRPPGGGHGNPLQYSCLENPMDRGAWWATIHRVTKSWTTMKETECAHTAKVIGPYQRYAEGKRRNLGKVPKTD